MLRNLLTVYMILSIVFDLSVANNLGLKKGTSAPYFKLTHLISSPSVLTITSSI